MSSSTISEYGDVDDSKWPIVRVTLIGSPASHRDLQNLFQKMDALYSREEIFVVIIDLLQTNYLIHPSYIYEMVQHMKKMTIYTKTYVPCLCLVLTSHTMAQTIECVKKLREPAIPWHIFPTTTKAEEYVVEMFQKAKT